MSLRSRASVELDYLIRLMPNYAITGLNCHIICNAKVDSTLDMSKTLGMSKCHLGKVSVGEITIHISRNSRYTHCACATIETFSCHCIVETELIQLG